MVEKSNFPFYKVLIDKILNHPFVVAWLLFRNAFLVATAVGGWLYLGHLQGSDSSAELTNDFVKLEVDQRNLITDLVRLQTELLDPNSTVNIESELDELRALAQQTLISLGQLRAPSGRIEDARANYQSSLEGLIGISNRIQREGVEGKAVLLHNGVQTTSNSAGVLRQEIERFQGGAVPQILSSIF